jgi:hypothetical protein
MPRQRDPELLTGYLCSFCNQRIKWGVILRVLRKERGQPDYEGRESYAHQACMRRVMQDHVPLVYHREWPFTIKWADDRAELRGKPCGLCGEPIKPHQKIKLHIQRPIGTVKQPSFMEESVAVHAACWRASHGSCALPV